MDLAETGELGRGRTDVRVRDSLVPKVGSKLPKKRTISRTYGIHITQGQATSLERTRGTSGLLATISIAPSLRE